MSLIHDEQTSKINVKATTFCMSQLVLQCE